MSVLHWVNNSLSATSNTIQRATNSAFTTGLTSFSVAPTATTYTDNAGGTRYWYRVIATNTIGLPGIGAYPTMSADSQPSNTIQVN